MIWLLTHNSDFKYAHLKKSSKFLSQSILIHKSHLQNSQIGYGSYLKLLKRIFIIWLPLNRNFSKFNKKCSSHKHKNLGTLHLFSFVPSLWRFDKWVAIVIHMNYFMGVLTLFLLFKGPYWLAHHQVFWNIGHSPIEAPLWTTSCKIETNVLPTAHLFSLYTWEMNLRQIILDKSKCYWERFEEQPWEFGNPMGTIRNMMGTREKKAFHWLHATFVSKTVGLHFHPTYSPLLLTRWGASQVQFFFFATRQFDWPITQKKMKIWG